MKRIISYICLAFVALESVAAPIPLTRITSKDESSAEYWRQNPLNVSVSFNAEIFASGHVSLTVKDYTPPTTTVVGGVTVVTSHDLTNEFDAYLDCDTLTNATPISVPFVVNKRYNIEISGTNWTEAAISLGLPAAPGLNSKKAGGTFTIPKDYTAYINGAESSMFDAVAGTSCSDATNRFTLEIRQAARINSRIDDDSNDADAAPGDAEWAAIGPGKTGSSGNGAISWAVNLGHLIDGNAAGRLVIGETGLSPEIYTPATLYYSSKSTNVKAQLTFVNTTDGVSASTNEDGTIIRQIRALQAFVDIVTQSTNQYEVRFYHASQVGSTTNAYGLYSDITGDPYVTYRILNPDPTNVLHALDIIELRNGRALTNFVAFDSTNQVWSVTRGVGADTRVETRTISFDLATSDRIELHEIKYAGGTDCYKSRERYHNYSWGWELISLVEDPDGAALTTTYDYYTIGNGNGQLHYIIYPDGYWEERDYNDDATIAVIRHPWKDGPATPDLATDSNSQLQVYSYTYGAPDVVIVQEYGGVVYGSYEETVWPDLHTETFNDTAPLSRPVGWFRQEVVYTEDAGPGLADHYIQRWNEEPGARATQCFYYDLGTFNSTAHSFSVSTNQNAWRMTKVYGCEVEPGGGDNLYHMENMEGHYLPSYYESPFVGVANQSWKETTIVANGATVQTEKYVFTGVDTNAFDEPTFELIGKIANINDSLGHTTNRTRIDPLTGSAHIVYQCDYKGTNAGDGDLLLSETDEFGIRTEYSYDSLKRLKTKTKKGVSVAGYASQPDIVTTITYDAQGRGLSNVVAASGLQLTSSATFDLAGRITSSTETNGLQTEYSYDLGVTNITQASGATTISANYLDRRTKSVTGSFVTPAFHDYYITNDSAIYSWPCVVDSINYGTATSTRTEKKFKNGRGDLIRDETPDSAGPYPHVVRYYYSDPACIGYDETGRPTVMYPEDAMSRTIAKDIYVPDWYVPYPNPFYASTDRISATNLYFLKTNSMWYDVHDMATYLIDNDPTPTTRGMLMQQLTGLSATTVSSTTAFDAYSNHTIVTISSDLNSTQTTVTTNSSVSSLSATNVLINGLSEKSSTLTVAQPALFYYDALGRLTRTINSQGYTNSFGYDATAGYLIHITNAAGQSTSMEYYLADSPTNAGRLKAITDAVGRKTFYDYDLRGHQFRTWGDVPYPQENVFDIYGNATEMHTYRGGAGWNIETWPSASGTADITMWKYQESTGLLTNKTDAQGRSVTFTYINNLLSTRTWARGVTTTNSYNDFGDLVRIDYTDGTPSVIYDDFRRDGLPRSLSDGTGAHTLSYDDAGRMISDIDSGGVGPVNHFSQQGRDSLSISGLSQVPEADFDFDSFGRLQSVNWDTNSSTYAYVLNGDLISAITNKSGSATVMATVKQYDYGYRLASIENRVDSTNLTSYSYSYDAVDRRQKVTMADSSYWQYGYSGRNELTNSMRHWADGSLVAGQQASFEFDNIGNRTLSSSGGDQWGANLRSRRYTANSLNQCATVTSLSYIDVMGTATNAATVTVNNQPSSRKLAYFRAEISFDNSSGPVYAELDTLAVLRNTPSDLYQAETNHALIAQNPELLAYDLDGNLVQDGLWTYMWDGENRLVQMVSNTNVPSAARKKLLFAYDAHNRRTSKVSYSWGTTNYQAVPDLDLHFVYDGAKLLAEFSGTNVVRSYCWGNDLSQGISAGGVGGLLAVKCYAASNAVEFVGYDGNGNVSVLVDSLSKNAMAQYEYSAFGEQLKAIGLYADANPFRFSTKYYDAETKLIYYGYRYYAPKNGSWLGRDPSGESGSSHLYAFCANSPIDSFDPDGCTPTSLLALAIVGPMAAAADQCFFWSSFCIPGWAPYGGFLGDTSAALQETGVVLSIGIDVGLGGKLLKNVGGPAGFVASFALGSASGTLPPGILFPSGSSQSFACAVVSGRLEALAAIGAGARDLLLGFDPNSHTSQYFNGGIFNEFSDATGRIGYDFALDMQKGDTAYGELDAALLAGSIWSDTEIWGIDQVTAAFTFDLLHGDAAAAFSDLPEYQALNAWDMATELLY